MSNLEPPTVKSNPRVFVNADSHQNPGGLSPPQNAKLPSPVKSSTLRKETSQTDQDHCDTEERFDVSWIKELSPKLSTPKGKTNAESKPAFVKSIPRLELPRFSGDPLEWPQFISLFKCLVHDQPLTPKGFGWKCEESYWEECSTMAISTKQP